MTRRRIRADGGGTSPDCVADRVTASRCVAERVTEGKEAVGRALKLARCAGMAFARHVEGPRICR